MDKNRKGRWLTIRLVHKHDGLKGMTLMACRHAMFLDVQTNIHLTTSDQHQQSKDLLKASTEHEIYTRPWQEELQRETFAKIAMGIHN